MNSLAEVVGGDLGLAEILLALASVAVYFTSTCKTPILLRMPSTPAAALFDLWRRLAEFPVGDADAALAYLQTWIAEAIGADNVIWIGAVRVLQGAEAEADPFLGWRLRDRVALRPDPKPYREQLAQYFDSEHYGKLSPTFYKRSHEAQKEDHVGMDSRATMAGCGRFRVYRIRDRRYLDFAAFEKTAHYRRYYLEGGIHDRIMTGFPVTAECESFFLIDRFQAEPQPRLFSLREATLVGDAVRGVPWLHRRLFLANGLLMADKVLSPLERQIVQGLLTGATEKDLAVSCGKKFTTLHKYVTGLYGRYGVRSRAAFMALWLQGG